MSTESLPQGWSIQGLEELGYTYTGLSGKTKEDFGSGKPYIPYMNIFSSTKVNINRVEYVSIEPNERQNQIQYGDILFTTSSETCDEVGMSSVVLDDVDEVYLNSFCFGFRPHNLDSLLPEFARYLFRSEEVRKTIGVLSQGSTRFNLSKNTLLKKLFLKLPPPPEQQKIAEILSTVDEKIEVIGEQFEQAQELKKGLMQRLLTKGIGHTQFKDSPIGQLPDSWEVAKIGEITTVVRGASPRPKGDPRYYGGNVPRLMGEDVTRDGKYVTPRIDFLTEEGAAKSRFMKQGTLTMVCSGNVGVPSILAVDACIHDGFLAFPKISDECSIDFLFYTFDFLRTKFHSSATHGGIFTNLTTSIIKEFEITLPPLQEQKEIANMLSTVDEKLEVLKEKKAQHQELKKGLMQQLLTGKMRVNHLIEQTELA